jgi:hypothetical protein
MRKYDYSRWVARFICGYRSGRRTEFRRLTHNLMAGFCVLALWLLSLSALWSTPTFASRGHIFSSSFGGSGTGSDQFDEPSGVAVSEGGITKGDVYVVDKGNARVERFSSTGAYESEFNGSGALFGEGRSAGSGGLPGEMPTGQFSEPEGITIDNDPNSASFSDVYVADTGHGVIDKFSATGEYIGQLTETASGSPLGSLDGVAVGANGDLWVYHSQGSDEVTNYSEAVANEFIGTREVSGFGFPEPGFAVDSKNNLYAHINGLSEGADLIYKFDEEGNELSGDGHTINNAIDKEPPTGVAVELSSSDVYIDNATVVGRYSPSGALIEHIGSQHLIGGSGIGVNSTTEEEDVYVADSVANKVNIFTPEPPGPPTIESESVTEAASSSATFSAQINPRGENTAYRFEYGPTTSYGSIVPVPDASIGSGFEVSEVSVHRQDLLPNTTYHFRTVAHNGLGPVVDGPDQTFITQPTDAAFALPDGRVWELVSPPDKHGAQLQPIAEQGDVVQASEDGSAITFVTNGTVETKPRGNLVLDTQVLSTHTAEGWSSQGIEAPTEAVSTTHAGHPEEYKFFSSDLSLGLLEPEGETPLAPEVSEKTIYLRRTNGEYEPLVTSANVPLGTKFGGKHFEGVSFISATPDLSHIVLESKVALTSTLSPEGGLYEWTGGHLQLISLLPGQGGTPSSSPTLGEQNQIVRHAISNDGSRVSWSAGNRLYMRDMIMSETIQVDAAQGVAEPAESEAVFQTASEDGSKVFFTDGQRLTADSRAEKGKPDLYEFEVAGGGPLSGTLTDLTKDTIVDEGAGVQGVALGASEDGSYIYFVATGVLGGSEKGDKETAISGANNLYMMHYDSAGWSTPKFLVSLSNEDRNDWEAEVKHENLSKITSKVSPNGHYFAFMSNKSLTGYNNTDARSGVADEEVYLYDAESGHLVCASCDPTGARPVGVLGSAPFPLGLLVDGPGEWNGRWLAGSIPGWTPVDLGHALYQSRYLSDSGRLFFDSADALVSADVNGKEDVYQYEPDGVGSCQDASKDISEKAGGCIGLISSGTSGEESAFLDASADGNDVFFLTAEKLVPQDVDTSIDVYDAHVCSKAVPCFTTPVSPPPCTTADSCKSVSLQQPAIFGPPASATFSGGGNPLGSVFKASHRTKPSVRMQKLVKALKMCAKKPKRKRLVCESRARKKYKATKPKATKKHLSGAGRR